MAEAQSFLKNIFIKNIQKVDAFKRRNGKSQSNNFIRSFVRRSMHPSKEVNPESASLKLPFLQARALQREAVRASQRRPKNVVLPEKSPNSPSVREMAATLEEKLELSRKDSGRSGNMPLNGKEAFPRMGNLRRSFARIRHKMAGKQIQEGNGFFRKPSKVDIQKRSCAPIQSLVCFFRPIISIRRMQPLANYCTVTIMTII